MNMILGFDGGCSEVWVMGGSEDGLEVVFILRRGDVYKVIIPSVLELSRARLEGN